MWLKETSPQERRTLTAAFAGYGVDAFDYMIYTFMIPTFILVWGMSKTQAGYIATGALITSAIGGWVAGVLADKYGRVKILQLTVLWFSFFTFLSGFTNSPEQLFVTRALQGLGFGGEWSVGSVLIAEMIQARHRGKAVGLVQSSWAVGWGVSALAFWGVYSVLDQTYAWRALFWLGVLPALLILYIRRNVEDPEVFQEADTKADELPLKQILSGKLLKTTIFASLLATGIQGGYYAMFTWIPTYLKTERDLTVVGTSGYLFVVIVGSFLGYLTAGMVHDRIGRKRAFTLFAACAGAALVLYFLVPEGSNTTLLIVGFPLGFFASGCFSGFGSYLSELFPTRARGTGGGFCYNVGRGIGALFPGIIGFLAAAIGLGGAVAFGVFGYVLAIAALAFLPETHGRQFAAGE